MQKLTALVTGATGFIGSHLSCELVKKGYKVYALSRSGVAKNEEFLTYVKSGEIEVICGDVSTIDLKSLPQVNYIYHVAGKVAVWGNMRDFVQTNVIGTRKMLEYAKTCSKLKCFIYFSSVAVYGFNGYSKLREGAEFLPMNNNYPISKILAEEEVVKQSCENKFDYVIVRPGNVYGEYDYTSSYDIYKRVKNKSMLICDGGKYESCFVYVGNLVSASIHLAEQNTAHNTDYNLTDGNNYTLNQVLTMVANEFNVPAKFKNFPAWASRCIAAVVEGFYKLFRIKKAPLITKFTVEQNLHDYSFSMEKTYQTKFRCPYTTEEGIKRTVVWFNMLEKEEENK